MQIQRSHNDVFETTLSREEAAYFLNTLNEVLRGFHLDNFEDRLKMPKDSVEALWKKLSTIHSNESGSTRHVSLSRAAIDVLRNASEACLEEFDSEEFATRVGQRKPFALALAAALDKSLS